MQQTDTKVPTDDFFAAHEFEPTCTMCEIHPAIWVVNWHGCLTTLRCDDCWNYEQSFVTRLEIHGGDIKAMCGRCKKIFHPHDIVAAEPIDPH
jgi:hypothetical protein